MRREQGSSRRRTAHRSTVPAAAKMPMAKVVGSGTGTIADCIKGGGRRPATAKSSVQDKRYDVGHAELVSRNRREGCAPARAIPHDHFHISGVVAGNTGHGERPGIDPASW